VNVQASWSEYTAALTFGLLAPQALVINNIIHPCHASPVPCASVQSQRTAFRGRPSVGKTDRRSARAIAERPALSRRGHARYQDCLERTCMSLLRTKLPDIRRLLQVREGVLREGIYGCSQERTEITYSVVKLTADSKYLITRQAPAGRSCNAEIDSFASDLTCVAYQAYTHWLVSFTPLHPSVPYNCHGIHVCSCATTGLAASKLLLYSTVPSSRAVNPSSHAVIRSTW
jgi:hypothetical protein